MLDVSPLTRALTSLDLALSEYEKDHTNLIIRDGCIQRFEYCYELSWKMLKRYIEATAANPSEIDGMSFQNLIRTGSEQGLLKGDWSDWRLYRESRGATSHTYNEDKAQQVFKMIPVFYEEALFLLKSLQAKTAS